MTHDRHAPTYRTDYRTHRPAPAVTVSLAFAALPLAVVYLLAHPAVAATAFVAVAMVAGWRRR